MLGKTRTVRFAIVGFVAVTVLVLSGLTWATVVSLRLERTTHEAQAALRKAQLQQDLSNRLEIARLRMDSVIWPVLIREISRPYREYGAFFYEDDGAAGGSLKASPLRSEATERWIALYFQVTEELCWTSPQLTPAKPRLEDLSVSDATARGAEHGDGRLPRLACVQVDESDPVAVERKNLLDQLRQAYTPEDFAQRIAAVWASPSEESNGAEEEARISAPDADSHGRPALPAALQQDFLPPRLDCEPAWQIYKVTGRDMLVPTEAAEREYFPVRVTPMAAIGLPLPGEPVPKLALVRRVDIGSERVFQGFLVDLPALTAALAPRVRDLFAHVSLELAFNTSSPAEAATRLGSLPVRLIVPEAPSAGHLAGTSFVWKTATFAWGTALVALAAIGLGVRRLVQLSERRKVFTYAVTHELRTPLTTFQLYTDLLAAGLVSGEKRTQYLETLHRESKRLSDLVTEVLEFSRIENNALRPQMQNHRVGELMNTVQERYTGQCSAAGLRLSIDGNGAEPRVLYTDPHITLQILGTLIDNACKYATPPCGAPGAVATGPKQEPPRLELRVIDAGHHLAFEVADNGPGIAPQDRRDLFKPFRRGAQESTARVGGVGLGLALAKRWTRLVRGTLEVVERPAQPGACFRLTLPAGPR